MKIEQIYTKCLSQASYFIESNGEAAVIDPIREVKQYLDKANSSNSKIKYIFQTHFHADFVSGHITLSEMTNAQIVYGQKLILVMKLLFLMRVIFLKLEKLNYRLFTHLDIL